MGSGSSKKKTEIAKKSSKQEQSQIKSENKSAERNSEPAAKNNQSAEKPESKPVIQEKAEIPEDKPVAMEKKNTQANASNTRNFTKKDQWQDADLASLMGGLELKDDPHTWQNYVDSLVTKTDPTIKPEKEVRLIPQ